MLSSQKLLLMWYGTEYGKELSTRSILILKGKSLIILNATNCGDFGIDFFTYPETNIC